ncbi:MAG: ABC transporter permease, partial [Planctomycetota bacterium]
RVRLFDGGAEMTESPTTGPGALYAFRVLFAHGFLRFLRSKRFLVALALCGLPAVGTMLLLYFGELYEMEQLVERLRDQGWSAYLKVVVPIMALLACTPAIGDEIEEGTIGYLTTRPLSRTVLFFGRFAGAVAWTLLFLGAGALALVLSSKVNPSEIVAAFTEAAPGSAARAGLALCIVSMIGGFAYGAIFTSLGALLRRSMIVGIAYVFAIEGFLSSLPGKARTLTLQFHLREALRSIGPGFWSTGPKDLPDAEVSLTAVAWVLLAVTVVALLLGSMAMNRRAFVRVGD